jgi:hypothetical protein
VDQRGVLAGLVALVAVAGCSSVVNGHGVAVPRSVHTATGGGFPSSPSTSSSSASRPGAVESPDNDFSVLLPDGWKDGTNQVSGIALTGYIGPVIDGFAININVLRSPVGDLSLQAFLRGTRANLRTVLHVTSMSPATPRLVDGENAYDYTVIDQQAGRALEQRQTLVIRDGAGYVITYSAPLSNYSFYRGAADTILDSWQWG